MKQAAIVASMLVSFGLAGLPAGPAAAQSSVVVPIVIQAPPKAGVKSSITVTTQTVSPQPGVTSTHVTVENTTGRLLGVVPGSQTGAAPGSAQPGSSKASVTATQNTTGRLQGVAPLPRPMATMPVPVASSSVQVGVAGRPGAMSSAAGPGVMSSTAAPRPPAPMTLQAGSSVGLSQTVTSTSDVPIDAPIVILGP